MRLLLPMISLLIRAIDGNLETHEGSLSEALRLGNDSLDVTADDRAGIPSIDVSKMSKMWKRDSFGGKRSRPAIDSRYVWSDDPEEGNDSSDVGDDVESDEYDRGRDSNAKVRSKEREAVDPRFIYKSLGKNKEFPTPFEEKKNPRLYRWEGKRPSPYDPSTPGIRRPIRVPFNSWGGKRGKGHPRPNLDSQMKRNKLNLDRVDRDTSMDGFDGVKRMAEMGKVGWKTPFNSWGGKRAGKSMGREEFLFSPEDTELPDVAKGGFADEKADGTHDNRKGKNVRFPYTILFRVCNETMRDFYTSEEESNGINDWLILAPHKRTVQHGPTKKATKKTKFDLWSGKEYFATAAHSTKRKNGFASGQWK